MTILSRGASVFVLSLLATACGSSDGGADEQGAGGTGAGGSGVTAGSGAGSSSGSSGAPATAGVQCSAPEPTVIAEGKLRGINVTSEYVYYVDEAEGPPLVAAPGGRKSGVVKRYAFASGEATTLFVPANGRILDLFVSADELFVYWGPLTDTAVHRLPIAGGSALTRVSPQDDFDGSFIRQGILGVVGSELILDGPQEDPIVAISLTDRSQRSLHPNLGITSVHLTGDRLWFADDSGKGAIYYRNVSALGGTPVEVYPGGCTNGDILRVGWFHASNTDIVCGGSTRVERLALDGSGVSGSWEIPAVNPRVALYPAFANEDAFYLASNERGVRVPLDGGAASFFSCDPVSVDAIAGNADFIVWGRSEDSGVVAIQDLNLNPETFSAILSLRR